MKTRTAYGRAVRSRRAAITAAATLVVVACGGGGDPAPTAGVRPSSDATIQITDPLPGSTVAGPTLSVGFELTGGTIVPDDDTSRDDLTGDEGHVHIRVDGKTLSQVYRSQGEVEVEPGSHLVEVEFVAKDHGPFNPRVQAAVTVEVT